MSNMFHGCSSLKSINLLNFNTQNVRDMQDIFARCSSLKKDNIISSDRRIFEEYDKLPNLLNIFRVSMKDHI